jgi:anthranilate/para-aminobenzoate synthase component I
VTDSDPDEEFDETLAKGRGMLAVLDPRQKESTAT